MIINDCVFSARIAKGKGGPIEVLVLLLVLTIGSEERRSIIMKAIEDEFNATPEQLALIGHLEGLTQSLFELAKQ
jgi:hypothetical protein